MDRARDWQTRLHHEASLHEENSFVTLTYAPEHLPDDFSVSKDAMQKFMKRLRKALPSNKIRFFLCGEYGGDGSRPHYHVLVFGFWPKDAELWRRTKSGELVYRSKFLEKIWPFGHVETGRVTLQSSGYVARYILKKLGGDLAVEHYSYVHPYTGAILQRTPEFVLMSNRPGIGSDWYAKYSADCFPSDFVVIDGQKRPIPRYYTKKLGWLDDFKIKADRISAGMEHADNNTPERLAIREEVLELKVAKLEREMETDE